MTGPTGATGPTGPTGNTGATGAFPTTANTLTITGLLTVTGDTQVDTFSAAGSATMNTLTTSGQLTTNGVLDVNGSASFSGSVVMNSLNVINEITASSVDTYPNGEVRGLNLRASPYQILPSPTYIGGNVTGQYIQIGTNATSYLGQNFIESCQFDSASFQATNTSNAIMNTASISTLTVSSIVTSGGGTNTFNTLTVNTQLNLNNLALIPQANIFSGFVNGYGNFFRTINLGINNILFAKQLIRCDISFLFGSGDTNNSTYGNLALKGGTSPTFPYGPSNFNTNASVFVAPSPGDAFTTGCQTIYLQQGVHYQATDQYLALGWIAASGKLIASYGLGANLISVMGMF
jgi:cytoskeletal protein CcmA (bactofilin family)